jgi:DNA polymerase III alpha subunit (gram-positive type)
MSKQAPEIYVSIDIETDGPAPGTNSMLSLGAVAYDSAGTQIGTWYKKIEPLPGASRNQGTMIWWQGFPDAWKEANSDQRSPYKAMNDFAEWCESLATEGKLVPVAWPAAFDFGFVNYYLWHFAKRNPLGFACLDMRSYANGLYRASSYYGTRGAVRDIIPEGDLYQLYDIKLDDLQQHRAIDDAIRQGRLFMAMLRKNQ